MKDEEMAENFANDFDYTDNSNYENNYQKDPEKIAYESYLEGLKAGRPQRHDLQKDPNDLPKDNGIKLCYTRTAKYVCASYDEEYNCWGFVFNNLEHCVPSSVIIAWCEIPTFDKE